jgi:hypothetical protein
LTFGAPQLAFAKINPPETPKPEPPPPPSSSGREPFKLKMQREMDENANQRSADEVRDKALAQESHQAFLESRPFAGFADASLYAARASVSNGRSGYQVDPGLHISAYIRASWRYKIRELQPWFGLRAAPFGGYGTQNGRTARYAHTWMGPALGIGKFLNENDRENISSPSSLVLLSAGLAGVTKLSNPAESESSPPRDFQSCSWCRDASGAWLEIRYTQISLGVVGLGGLIGVQTGFGKVFSYGGLTVSGFY